MPAASLRGALRSVFEAATNSCLLVFDDEARHRTGGAAAPSEGASRLATCSLDHGSIDVGAGQGAFSLRLQDEGFEVMAVDTNAPDFKATSVPFTKAPTPLPLLAKIEKWWSFR